MDRHFQRVTYRDKLESGLSPAIHELRETLAFVSLRSLITNYQMRFYLADDRATVPDGHWAKWRFLWAQAASPDIVRTNKVGRVEEENVFERLDQQIEDIYNFYTAASFMEKGQFPGSREEFLMRLGVAVQTRETTDLAFPEQVRDFLLSRMSHLDKRYFLPELGLPFKDVLSWVERLKQEMQHRLNDVVDDLHSFLPMLEAFYFAPDEVKRRVQANAKRAEEIGLFRLEQMTFGFPVDAVAKLISILELDTKLLKDFKFPHQKNPLDSALLIKAGTNSYFAVDPTRATRVLDEALVNRFRQDEHLYSLYLRIRDKALEKATAEC